MKVKPRWIKGECVVCVFDRFANYTKGKMYQIVEDTYGSFLIILNDKGEKGSPSAYGYESDKFITYFDKVENIREEKLKQLGIN